MNIKVLEAVVPGEAPARLDVFLAGQFPEFSRSRIQQLIHAGLVSVEGQPAEKSGQTVLAGQQIRMEIPPPVTSALTGEKIELQVIFEDENVLVIDKPAGMVVHPSYGHGSGTLVNAVLGREGELPQINGEFRPGIVHRLDKETSGLILIAKNDRSLQFLQDQFKSRQVEKIYQTLVDGCPPTPLATVYGFAVALGLLSQKMKAVHHVQEDGEHSKLLFPEVPLELRIEVEREARRMAGYWAGRTIANTFLGAIKDGDSKHAISEIEKYLKEQDDPRLTEIMRRLEEIFLSKEAST